MPKTTFFNLSDEKKDRIFDAALQEFSARTFSQASLNQIIKNAGIPKGSFYQYFDSKEDLYLYLREIASKKMKEILSREIEMNPDADAFEVILYETREFLERGETKPGYIEAAMLAGLDNSEFIKKLRNSSNEKYIKMVEHDKERGLIKPEVDSELVVNMISSFSLNEYFRDGSDKEKYLKNLSNAIKVIKEGILLPKN